MCHDAAIASPWRQVEKNMADLTVERAGSAIEGPVTLQISVLRGFDIHQGCMPQDQVGTVRANTVSLAVPASRLNVCSLQCLPPVPLKGEGDYESTNLCPETYSEKQQMP